MVFLRAVHHWVFLFAWFFGSSPPWGFLELFTVCFFGIPLRFCLGFFSWNATTPSIFGVLHRCCGGVLHHCHPGEVLHCACLEECINISLFVSPSPFVFWELSTLGAFWEVSSLRVLRILQPKAFWECSSLLVFWIIVSFLYSENREIALHPGAFLHVSNLGAFWEFSTLGLFWSLCLPGVLGVFQSGVFLNPFTMLIYWALHPGLICMSPPWGFFC